MHALPEDVVAYKRTPSFTEETVPAGLLADHETRQGVWGLLVVEDGRLSLRWEDGAPTETLSAGDTAVIAPTRRHAVVLGATVRFHVVLHRVPRGPTVTPARAGREP